MRKKNITIFKVAWIVVPVILVFISCMIMIINGKVYERKEIEIVPIDEKLERLIRIEMMVEALLEEFGYIPCNKFVDYNETHTCTDISTVVELCKCKKFENITDAAEQLIGDYRFYRSDLFWLLFDKWEKLGRPCLAWMCEIEEDVEYCKCYLWKGD